MDLFGIDAKLDGSLFSTGFFQVKPYGDTYVSKLMYYYLSSSVFLKTKDELCSGSTQSALNDTNAKKIKVPLPPLGEQNRIVNKIEELFSELDSSIEGLQKAKNKLKHYRQSVLKSAFEGKLTEAWREEHQDELADAEVLLECIKQEREEAYEKSLEEWKTAVKLWEEKGKEGKKPTKPRMQKEVSKITSDELKNLDTLPKTWSWVKLGELTTSVKDGPHYSPKYVDDGIPFISGGNIRPDGIDFENVKYITQELHEELSLRCKPELGDILYTKGGTTGIARVNTYNIEFNVWVHVAVLKIVPTLTPFYMQYVLNAPFAYKQAQNYTHGVGNQDLGLTRMIHIILPICSTLEQVQIVKEIESRYSEAHEMERTIDIALEKAKYLRQSILKKAFEGELIEKDPNDESVSILLDQIQQEKEMFKLRQKQNRKNKGRKKVQKALSLTEVLQLAEGHILNAKELWKRSKYQDDIEAFYAALKESIEIDKTIIESKNVENNESYLRLIDEN